MPQTKKASWRPVVSSRAGNRHQLNRPCVILVFSSYIPCIKSPIGDIRDGGGSFHFHFSFLLSTAVGWVA